MKRKLTKAFVATLLLLSFVPENSKASAELASEKKVVKNSILYTDDYIINQAINGIDLNLPKVETKVYDDGKVKIVELSKTLSETVQNGKIIETENVTVMDVSVNADEITTQEELEETIQQAVTSEGLLNVNSFEPVNSLALKQGISTLSTGSGNLAREQMDNASTVNMRYNVYFSVYTNSIGTKHFKINYVNYFPTLLDSKFKLTAIESQIGYYGSGYFQQSDGTFKADVYEEKSISYSVKNPVSQTVYTKQTGFNFYVVNPLQTDGVSLMAATATLKFQRPNQVDAPVYSLKMPTIVIGE